MEDCPFDRHQRHRCWKDDARREKLRAEIARCDTFIAFLLSKLTEGRCPCNTCGDSADKTVMPCLFQPTDPITCPIFRHRWECHDTASFTDVMMREITDWINKKAVLHAKLSAETEHNNRSQFSELQYHFGHYLTEV